MLEDTKVPGFERLRVLLVEDDAFAQRLATAVLRQLGVTNLVVVKDGQAAIQQLSYEDARFDLIISDWNMPNVSGLDLLKHVRSTWENMPFLMLTGNANEEFVRTAQANKVDAYVIKPFSPAQLKQKIMVMFRIKPS
ncbi:response regulator [Ferrovibrio sp.]|uniref:response regulator n=1 Tax=Ferrovibrio sp. TaxID=1917215 RepID=UPI001B661CE7|nr:response regulator [Ferrovibrio sp.]MBP7066439.1 response regulator [Ferrovibrio sp.]